MSKLLWIPSKQRVQNSAMCHFIDIINKRYGQNIKEYNDLYDWSVSYVEEFWKEVFKFTDIKTSSPYDSVIDNINHMPGTKWFSGAKLNFAENLLRYRDDHTAIVFKNESNLCLKISYKELYDIVSKLSCALRDIGVKVGDRVVGFMPNIPQTVFAMIATTSIGATWSSCSPDFGTKGVLDRFGQIKPKVLFTADGYIFKGKKIDSSERVANILKEMPTIGKVIVVPYISDKPNIDNIPNAVNFDSLLQKYEASNIVFEQVPFGHPLYIMYSSGTTGLPKCMVQSVGGILINQLKEHVLHTNVNRDETIFYYTTCGWMMWNWLVCGLATGTTIVLYDGNPFHPDPGALWKMAQDEKITIFGTSAAYLSALEKTGLSPKKSYDLSKLKTILSTGSPLSNEGFEFVYKEIKEDIQLASISGGTDINGCFALGNPLSPVYSGELQGRGLGMKILCFDENANPVWNQKGELVCTTPLPSMPIYFWDDPDGKKYHNAYFDVYPNIWRHGDFIEINDHGGVVISGRSDATLNPGGVRIGTADIYRIVECMEEIADSIVVSQDYKDDVRVILFVKMKQGYELTETLKNKIVNDIKQNASPRHVPAKIIAVPDIPYTLNMKKVELAVRKTIHNQDVQNKDALLNPNVLEYYKNISELINE